MLICTAALLLKLLVPTGYMVVNDHGSVTVAICPGVTSAPRAQGIPGAPPVRGMPGAPTAQGMPGAPTAQEMPGAMPGMDHGMTMAHGPTAGHDGQGDHGGKDHRGMEMPCAYAGLSAQVLGAVDPSIVAAALAVVAAAALLAISPVAPRPARHLRPPLRGPPPGRIRLFP